MTFKEFVVLIKSQGCKVTIYKTKEKIGGANGLFYDDPPHIKLATRNKCNKSIASILLHEYAHFLQWREGFSQYLDAICWSHQVFEDWTGGKIELTEREIKMCRNTMLGIEYDAEIRSLEIGRKIDMEHFDPDYHLREAMSYCVAIKWAWANRSEWKKRPEWNCYPSRRLNFKELFAPLTSKEKEILKNIRRQD